MQLIGKLDEEKVNECQTKYELAEDMYCIAGAALRGKLTELAPRLDTQGQSEAGASSVPLERPLNVNVSLPDRPHDIKNTWGNFDGSLLQWPSFRDCFIARIHNDDKIPNVYKFTYLKKSLTGKALQTLGEWHLTEDSYAEAWTRLLQVYDKEYPIIREYLRQFERLPSIVGQATTSELQRLSNVTHETLRQLKAMQLPVDSWDMWIVHNLHERLDPDTGKEWEKQRTSERPTATEILDFLDKQATIAINTSNIKGKPDIRVSVKNDRSRQLERVGPSKPSDVRSSTPYGQRQFPCEACSDMHPLYYCDDYLALSLSARWAFVRKRSLCPNCLKKGHTKEKCFSVACNDTRCKSKDPLHNSTLCEYKVGNQKVMTLRNVTSDSRGASSRD